MPQQPDNNLVLVDDILKQRQAERPMPLKESEAFELFACEQALRDTDLSSEEIAIGVVGGGNDAAIDGIYVFLGDVLLSDDSEIFQDTFQAADVSPGAPLSLWLVQAKTSPSFTETAIDLAASGARRLLDLSMTEANLAQKYGTMYSAEVMARTGLFRRALRKLAGRHPTVDIHFCYVTRGRTNTVNEKVLIKARELEEQLGAVISNATGEVELLGAAELLARASATPVYTSQLAVQDNALDGISYVVFVKLRDYLAFLTDEKGSLRRHLFDLNVRDFAGNVEVNREIQRSLADSKAPEFWWLNNGITIVCSKATSVGRTYAIDNVQIVNGLQTSTTIYNVLRNAESSHPAFDHSVLVRILVTGDDPAVRDQVIRATNRQTSVPAASLRATDGIQRNIERYFFDRNWYYDRRKNFYRNTGKSAERIISIELLAQAVMAMGLSRPDDSRARPSSLLKKDDDYAKIFSEATPLPVYLWLAQSQKEVDAFLASEDAAASRQERTNLRFYLSMMAVAALVGRPVYDPTQLAAVAIRPKGKGPLSIAEADLARRLMELREDFDQFAKESGDAPDKIAKGRAFVEYLLSSRYSETAKAPKKATGAA
jgi:hypothetical protein